MEKGDDFIVGVNYPWRHYGQDFGHGPWGYCGFASAAAEVRSDFRRIAEALDPYPRKLLRIFIFADGRSAPKFGENGEVLGYDAQFFEDFDLLLCAAEESSLELLPVLLDFHWCRPASIIGNVRLAGHADTISNPGRRAQFLERAVAPLVDKYQGTRSIFAWELINEPEWILRSFLPWRRRSTSVSLSDMREFVRDCTELLHRRGERVTLGSARPQWLRYWMGLGLDLYQCHWYLGRTRLRLAAARTLARLDKPCLVGEVPTNGRRASPAWYLQHARNQGYSGVLFWSYRAKDKASNFGRLSEFLG